MNIGVPEDELQHMRAQVDEAVGVSKSVLTIRTVDAKRLLATIAARDEEIAQLKAGGLILVKECDSLFAQGEAAEVRVAQLEAALQDLLTKAETAERRLGPKWTAWSDVAYTARAALKGTP